MQEVPKHSAVSQAALEQIRKLQDAADKIYGRLPADQAFQWFIEEIGELARALRRADRANTHEELGQIFAWVLCLGNILQIDLASSLEHAFGKEVARQLQKHGRIKPYSAGAPAAAATLPRQLTDVSKENQDEVSIFRRSVKG